MLTSVRSKPVRFRSFAFRSPRPIARSAHIPMHVTSVGWSLGHGRHPSSNENHQCLGLLEVSTHDPQTFMHGTQFHWV